MAMVKDAIFNEEARRNEMGQARVDEPHAFYSDGNKGRNQTKKKGKWKAGSNSSQSKGVTCYHCHKEGHIKRYCPKYLAECMGNLPNEAAVAVQESDDDYMLAVLDATDAGKSDWVLDSGCSNHVCGDKSQFWDYEACDGGLVQMANGSTNQVVGKGTVRFRVPSGKIVKVAGVRHVPGVKKNLISLGKLDERGCSFLADSGALRVSGGGQDLLLGKKVGGLYKLVGSVITRGAAVRHGTSGIGCSVGQEMRQLQARAQSKQGCSGVARDTGKRLMQVVHRKGGSGPSKGGGVPPPRLPWR